MPASPSAAWLGPIVAAGCTVVAGALAWSAAALPARAPELGMQVLAERAVIGVGNPVTTVLLDLRSYDTLLEIAVLVLALSGVWALRAAAGGASRTAQGGLSRTSRDEPSPVLDGLARTLAPIAIVVAGYLWWAGTSLPGGAFQAGAVLAAAGVVLVLAGRLPPERFTTVPARSAAVVGLLAFLALGVGLLAAGRGFLDWPPGGTATGIAIIEGVLSVSIGCVLAALFADAYAEPVSGEGS